MQTQVTAHGFEYGVKHFYSPADGLAIDIIQTALNLDQSVVLNLFLLGSVYINHQRVLDANHAVNYGHQMRVHTKPRRYFVGYDWKSRIIFEHDDFVILNKPSGLPSHPSVDNVIENSLTQLERALNIKLLISHRLDTTTEGLIVYGKKPEFVKAFNLQLQSKNIEKKYVALIQTRDALPGRLIHYMEPSPRAPKKVTPIFTEGWDECELLIEKQMDYKVTELIDLQLIHINLLTGRTHQIRAQLAEAGYPLVGDKMYGSELVWAGNSRSNAQVALKSYSIEFTYLDQRHFFELPAFFEVI